MKIAKVPKLKHEKKDVFYIRGVYVRLIDFFDKLVKEKGYTTRGQLLNHILLELEKAEEK